MNNEKRKNILFVVPSLGGGGAEKVCLNIIKYINREKFIPSLVLFEKRGVYLDEIPEDVVLYDLKKRSRFDFFKLVYRLAYVVYPKVKPDVVISFLSYANFVNILTRAFSLSIKPNIVISERTYSSISLKYTKLKMIKLIFMKKVYPWADRIVTVSSGINKDLTKSFNISSEKIKLISNGVDLAEIEKFSMEPVTNKFFNDKIPVIISCGRLVRSKNYPILLSALYKVLRKHDAKLLILGEGIEKDNLIKLSNRLGLANRVFFLGFRKNPFKYIAKADVFVLSSIYEGYPNVLIEAMACGTAVISTCCPSGPEEIITDGVNGLLVPVGDADAMSKAILELLKDKKFSEGTAEAGKIKSKDFKLDKMILEYEDVFSDVISR